MKTEVKVDSVRLMRELRDQISQEITGMSYEEENRYIQDHLKHQEPPETKKAKGRVGTR